MKPGARLSDLHTCPLVTPAPHVGGPVVGPGEPTVLLEQVPGAVVGDICVCVGPPDTIATGSGTVLYNNKPAARLGDLTAHGGVIIAGAGTVLVGG